MILGVSESNHPWSVNTGQTADLITENDSLSLLAQSGKLLKYKFYLKLFNVESKFSEITFNRRI